MQTHNMLNNQNPDLLDAPLGQQSLYIDEYQPDLLFPIPRKNKRDEIGITGKLPFHGSDFWNAFELSWLNAKGKPVVAMAEFNIACESHNIIESKSFKLYLNSFNNTVFDSFTNVENTLIRDLSNAAGTAVGVKLLPLAKTDESIFRHFSGTSLDDLDIQCDTYTTEPAFLSAENEVVTETVYSDLLKSNCLVTGQPDWGSVQITYAGKKIRHEGLLKYLVSFRNHNEFHEQCVERIFVDIIRQCAPEKLFVYARYTRRGGLDINPYRANYPVNVDNSRLCRQ
jgi:7-cyano-7-deazaguanine reductase